MDEFEARLGILADCLEKKKLALSQILSITENQKTVLEGEADDNAALFFKEMNAEKQKLIDHVLELDKIFESVFEKVSDEFDERGPMYKDSVRRLQDGIKAVMDLDVSIRVTEDRNKANAHKLSNPRKIKMPRVSKNYLLEQYRKNK